MDVILINPPWEVEGGGYGVRSGSRWPHTRKDKHLPFPMFLAYTAAVLEKNGYNVHVIDAVARGMNFDDVKNEVTKYDPRLIMIETSTPSINFDVETARILKSQKGDFVLAMAGPHATVFATELLKEHEFIDVIIHGEYEYTMLDLANAIREGKAINKVKGISFRENRRVAQTEKRPFIENLDELPFPAQHYFRLEDYSQIETRKSIRILSSRGCPFHCVYCLWPDVMYGHKFRGRSAKNVVDEIEYVIEKYDVQEIDFDDDTFTLSRKRVIDICNEINNRGLKIRWRCMGRVDTVDREMMQTMKNAGCYQICFGVESGVQKILDNAKKNITIEQIKKAFGDTKEIGLETYGTFTFGLPGETQKTIEETIKFAKELDPDIVQFSIVTPYPGTQYYDMLNEKGFIKTNDWSRYDGTCKAVFQNNNICPDDLEKAVHKAWVTFYFRPTYILKRIIKIRSMGGLKRLLKGGRSIFIRHVLG
jgi:radical SAM superfamily enzyme YgiQ (UPF0313 family)